MNQNAIAVPSGNHSRMMPSPLRDGAKNEPLAHGPPRDLPNHGFARHAHQERLVRRQPRQGAKERRVVRGRLAEAETRIPQDALARNARRT